MRRSLSLLLAAAAVSTPAFADEPAAAPAASAAPAPAAPTAPEPSEALSNELLGTCWSGHPVTFGFLTERGYQYVAYYDADRKITLLARKLGAKEWTRFQPEGVNLANRGRPSNVTGWDSHNYLALALDTQGYLHLSGNMHNDPLIYYRTQKPFDITTFERLDKMTGEREGNTTYPVFFKAGDGTLMFRYRDGSSGNGADIYNRYDTETKTWSRIIDTPLLDGQGKRNAYATQPVLGPDGYFHIVWMWRESPDCSTNNNLSYARSLDFKNWEKSDGTPVALPITRDTGDVIDPAQVKDGLINMTFNIGFDALFRPVVVYHRYDMHGKSQAYAARPAIGHSGWFISQISDWDFRWQFSGGGSITAEVTLGPAIVQEDESMIVDFSTMHKVGNGRWRIAGEDLKTLQTLPPPPPLLTGSLAKLTSTYQGMEVQTLLNRANGKRWVLRWETLPRNRDMARPEAPPPTELRLLQLPDGETGGAFRIGS